MATPLPLRCTCGKLHGRAQLMGSGRELRLVCHCGDCQAYAHFLGHPDAILDDHGGTEVLQMSPARIELTDGAEQLACVRLSAKGLMRWYASCCNTAIANTMATPRMPFAGLVTSFASPDIEASAREQLLGPVRARINGPARPSGSNQPPVSVDRFPIGTILRSIRMLASGWIRGEHRPSPFFDPDGGAPRVTPQVLAADEREELRRSVERWRSAEPSPPGG